ncbi:MAG TPA: hypothetical protein VM432_08780 [Bdellovibrionales bacterium]|nr:hypothetical protein [Bdellovibrionales bacterium]
MRKTLIASGLFFLLFFYGLILSQSQFAVISEELEPKNPEMFYDYKGVSNVHTARGLGSGSYEDIIEAALETNLDFIAFTDLNPFVGPPVPEGYHRDLLVIKGAEYSYLDARLLVFDVDNRHSFETLGQTQTLLADLLSQSGPEADKDLILLAHPTKPGYEWSEQFPSGLDGIEVINLKSIWRQAWENSKFSFIWSTMVYPFNSPLALIRLYEEPQTELSMWDSLSLKRHTVGIAGSDATAKTSPVSGEFLRFPSYQTSFSMLSNHVLLRSELTGEAAGDTKKILGALSSGNFYMSLDVLGDPKGFVAYIRDDEKIYPMGSRVKWVKGMKMIVKLPQKPNTPFEAAFLKDGQHVMSSNSVDTEYIINGPGVYRVTVRVFLSLTLPDGNRWYTWLYTNPFYLD